MEQDGCVIFTLIPQKQQLQSIINFCVCTQELIVITAVQLTMGRGKRFIRWLKELLFHKKRSNVTANKTTGFSDWEESEIPCIAPGSPAESNNVDIRTSFSDISIGTFLSHEPSLTGSVQPQMVMDNPFTDVCGELEGQVPDYSDYPPQFDVKWSMFGWDCNEDSSSNVWPPPPMTFGGKDLLERSASHHEDLNTIVDNNEWLFPIEECYSKASIKLPNLPKPSIIITSNFGNVAFEVNFAQEEHPNFGNVAFEVNFAQEEHPNFGNVAFEVNFAQAARRASSYYEEVSVQLYQQGKTWQPVGEEERVQPPSFSEEQM